MGWIAWIILGGVAGAIAKYIMKEEGGLLKNIVLGILGAVVGGWLMSLIGGQGVEKFNLWGLLVAVIGAIIIIYIGRVISGRKA